MRASSSSQRVTASGTTAPPVPLAITARSTTRGVMPARGRMLTTPHPTARASCGPRSGPETSIIRWRGFSARADISSSDSSSVPVTAAATTTTTSASACLPAGSTCTTGEALSGIRIDSPSSRSSANTQAVTTGHVLGRLVHLGWREMLELSAGRAADLVVATFPSGAGRAPGNASTL
ncbi:hypothetical protein Atai01_68290 [Amycolatopsis taiwanensis]|uniref:Uncharacterized protein n=1 Tax=Amycolatopsis taiwanensis TaxID=342230 RepID=A0A9W6RA41_9PSEU|nr:hypothetical protein Atai01_68290 [Amycolatopsis taiwanensis]